MPVLKYLKFAPFYLISLLPLSFLYGLAYPTYILLFKIIGYRKNVVQENLKNSFPNLSISERRKIELKFYRHFTELFLESMKVLSISKTKALNHLKFSNLELLEKYYQSGDNLILYGAHFGNWEWFAFFPLHIKHQFVSFYQEQSNSYFNELSILMRERFGNICIESKFAYKKLLELNNSGVLTLAYMIGDQSPMNNSSMIWTDFLNQRTAFLTGADRIAKKAGMTILYPHIVMNKRSEYIVTFKEIDSSGSSEEVISSYAKLLESNIKEQAELWLWTHRRWKIKEEV